MPHVRAYKAAEVRALSAAEHEEASAALARLVQLNTEVQAHDALVDGIELDMGKILAEALDRDWARAVHGVTTAQWAADNLRGRDGYPLGEDSAWRLARDWRAISQYPAVEALLRGGTGPKRKTSRTAAFYACEIATMSGWREEALQKRIDRLKEINDASVAEAREQGEFDVNQRILDLLRRKTASVLRDDYYATKRELSKQGESAKQIEWVSFKGSVPREVAERFDEALYRTCKFADDDLDLNEASMTQKLERVSGWALDAFEAVEAHNRGNSGPLQSIIEQAKERLK